MHLGKCKVQMYEQKGSGLDIIFGPCQPFIIKITHVMNENRACEMHFIA